MSTDTEMVSLRDGEGATGALKVVRAGILAKEGTTGLVAKGIFEASKPNKFNPGKNDYFIRDADNTLYIVNGTKSLADQLEQEGIQGNYVEVHYDGAKKTKKGATYHDFNVMLRRV